MNPTKWELLDAIEGKIEHVYEITRIYFVGLYILTCLTFMWLTILFGFTKTIVIVISIVMSIGLLYITYNNRVKVRRLNIMFEIINYYCDDGEGGIEIENY